MKNIYLLLIISILSFHTTFGQNHPKQNCTTGNKATLKINFSTDGAKGVLYIAVYDSKESFMKIKYKKYKLNMLDGKNKQLVIEGLCLNNDYSVSAFLDENDNAKLDKNFLGVPKESYGFSKNVKGSFGPPSYDQTKITLENKDELISILIK